ncbi:hypothetical protein D3C72_1312380 [compost metagenome]
MEQQAVQPKLSWDDVWEQFENLIYFAANQQISNRGVDPMNSYDDLVQEGIIKLHECWEIWCVNPANNKDMDEFGPIFRKSLFRKIKQSAGRPKGEMDLDDAAPFVEDVNMRTDSIIDALDHSENMQRLMSSLSPTAQLILQELAQPSERTLLEVWADTKRKEQLKAQGKRVNVPKDNTVRMKHIVRSIGITDKQYDKAIIEIRETAHRVYQR